ncbi:hypothetical protein CCP3SC5AM1_1060003 [Gammaproteobacteria bacterium]
MSFENYLLDLNDEVVDLLRRDHELYAYLW